MSGTVGIVANDTARYTLFPVCVSQLRHPPNTFIDWALSTDVPKARNTLVERSLERGSEWILFLDDDHVFPPSLLMRLLEHEQPIVSSLYLARAMPFAPVAFSHLDEEGLYHAVKLADLPGEGLLKVRAVGTSGMLIRSEVFRAIDPPWFVYGREESWNASEDIVFCEKARDAGFDVYLDLEAQLGHMTPSAIWPSFVDKEWVVGFSVADGLRLYYPIEPTTGPAPADSKVEVAASLG
jgi:hypothetical protein